MAIQEKSRTLRPAHGDWVVILVDDFGTEHQLVVPIVGEKCPGCGDALQKLPDGTTNLAAEIEKASVALNEREAMLKAHMQNEGLDFNNLTKCCGR